VLITMWESLFSMVLPGCCFVLADRGLIGLIGWHSSCIEYDQPAIVE
jgi:hypothetical protein